MKFLITEIPGVYIIEPMVFDDTRGYFLESFNKKMFEETIGFISFVQDNESSSTRGVLRGLHFQKPPYSQSKLVRCIRGNVLDVVVDIRKGSPTFGKHLAVELSGENKRQLFVPRGFAHGYVVLSNDATFAYKVDNYYAPDFDAGISWNDPDLNIDWKISKGDIYLSNKDATLSSFSDIESPFIFNS